MERIYQVDEVLSTLKKDEYFVDFLNTKSLEAGLIRLRRDQKDTQTSHSLDELYYVVEGEGYIRIKGEDHRVTRGTTVFVPADTEHNFRGNEADLIVFYVFPKA